MRPKIALSILLVGLMALVVFGMLRHLTQKADPVKPVPTAPPAAASARVPASRPAPPPTGIVATTPDQDRLARKQADLDAIANALAKGDEDPESLTTVGLLLENPEPDVRVSAREAAVHLGNTNFIPFLQAAIQRLEDPREKAALLDAIEYLQLPSVPDGGLTNDLGPVPGAGTVPPANKHAVTPKAPPASPTAPK